MSRFEEPGKDVEAARWFAVIRRGVMTLEERARYESWRRAPANESAMAELEQAWEALQVAQSHLGPRPAQAQSRWRARIARPALLAVMCAASIVIGVISYSGNHNFWTSLDWVDR